MYDEQNMNEEHEQEKNHQEGLNGNLVPESNAMGEGEENIESFQKDHNLNSTNADTRQINDNSFHLDKIFEKVHQNPKFSQKENEFSQKIDDFIQQKIGKPISIFQKHTFLANKLLLLTTFFEFLFQRFDVVTLALSVIILLVEIGIFSHKHLYKWLFVLLGSLLLDAFVLIDVSPVSYIFNLIIFFIGREYLYGFRSRKYYF